MLTLCHNFFHVAPNTKHKDVQTNKKGKYIFGIFLLILANLVWVASSELTKFLYVEKKLERPFLVTYIRSSLLFVYLLVLCITSPARDPCIASDYTQLIDPSSEGDDENYFQESVNSLGDSTFVPVRTGETTDSDDAAPRAVRFNNVAEVRVMSAAQAGEAVLARLSWAATVRAGESARRRAAARATAAHLRTALALFLPWFISNYLYRLSLLYTSTGCASVYTSTTGSFAIILSAIFAQSQSDQFNFSKFASVLLSASAVLLNFKESQTGGLIALLTALASALCYAVHLLMFRFELKKGDNINSPLLLGLVGCACGGAAWCGGAALAAAGVEPADLPPPRLLGWLLLDAMLGPLMLETIWLWSNHCTSSKSASLSVALWPGVGAAWGGSAPAALLAAAAWTLAQLPTPAPHLPLHWLRDKMADTFSFFSLKNMGELDEQSEALMSSDELT